MPQPQPTEFPTHIREVLQFMTSSITSGDLYDLQQGELCDENLINVYFKTLEKINLLLLRANEYIKQQKTGVTTPQVQLDLVKTKKVLYCNSNFLRELKNCQPNDYEKMMNEPETDQKRKYEKILKDITDNDVVLIPFFPEPSDQSQF